MNASCGCLPQPTGIIETRPTAGKENLYFAWSVDKTLAVEIGSHRGLEGPAPVRVLEDQWTAPVLPLPSFRWIGTSTLPKGG